MDGQFVKERPNRINDGIIVCVNQKRSSVLVLILFMTAEVNFSNMLGREGVQIGFGVVVLVGGRNKDIVYSICRPTTSCT